MADKGMFLVANLVTYYEMKERAAEFGMSSDMLAKNDLVIEGGLQPAREFLRTRARHGVLLLACTTGVHLSPPPPCRFAHSLQALCCAWAGRHPPRASCNVLPRPLPAARHGLPVVRAWGTAARPPEPEEAIV